MIYKSRFKKSMKTKPILSEVKINKLIVYHGSSIKDIKKFNTETSLGGDYGAGAYFTADKSRAKEHGMFLYTCELTLKNPYVVKDKYEMNYMFDSLIGMRDSGDIPETMDMRSYIMSLGFDGIIVKNPNLGGSKGTKSPYYIAYNNNQIKIINIERIK